MRRASPFLLVTWFAVVGLVAVDRGHAAGGRCWLRASAEVSPGPMVEFEESLVVRLDGSAITFGPDCDDPVLSFSWRADLRPNATTIVDPTSPTTDVQIHKTGTFIFILDVTGEGGNIASANVWVETVPDLEAACTPVAVIEQSGSALLPNGEPQTINLSGAGSHSGLWCDALTLRSFLWEGLDGAPAPEPTTGPDVSVTFDTPGDYTYRLTVESGDGDQATDEVTVPVRAFESPVRIVRGDVNADRQADIPDAIIILSHLFQGGPMECANAANINSTDPLDISDPIRLLMWLFQGGPPPDPPAVTSHEGSHYSLEDCGSPVGRSVNGLEQLDLGCGSSPCLE